VVQQAREEKVGWPPERRLGLKVGTTLTFLSLQEPNAPFCLGCQLQRPHLEEESLNIKCLRYVGTRLGALQTMLH
jgi:hypothetical protein